MRPYNNHKFSFHSKKCVFLGYSPQHSGYSCLDIDNNRIYYARHVQFDESIFPFKTSHLQSPPSAPISVAADTSIWLPSPGLIQPPLRCSNFSGNTPITTLSPYSPTLSTSLAKPIQTPALSSSHLIKHPITSLQNVNTSPPRQSLPSTNLNASSFSPSTGNSSTPSISPLVIPETIPSDPESTGLKLVADLNNSNKPTRLHHMKLLSTTLSKKKFAHLSTHSTTDVEPSSFAKAQSLPMWQQAMQNEIDALHKNNTWTLVPPPLNANVVGNRWLYKIKRHADGSIERYKARLVAKGFTQEYGFDYTETFSPVVKPITIRTLLSIVVSGGWDISQLDISNAFLNGDLQETVYMVQPQGFIDPHRPHYVCRLNKSLYGLRQSPRTWSQRLGTYLLTLGFKKSTADPSLFIYRTKSCVCFVLVYVDDVIITCSSSTLIQEFIHQLSKEFDLRNLGPLHYFLGIQVLKHSSGIILTQQKYLLDTLISANMHESKPWSTPMVSVGLLNG